MKITLELTLEEFKKIRIVEDGELRPLIPTAMDSEKPVKTPEPTESEGHADPNEPIEQTKTEKTDITREELRAYMMARCKAAGRNIAREVIQDMGYDNLADVPEEKLSELYEKMKEVA